MERATPATPTRPYTKTVALVGGRGHTGAELIRILDRHPSLLLTRATSRELAGTRIAEHVAEIKADLHFSDEGPDEIARSGCEVVILALPNGASPPYVDALDRYAPDTIIVDLSADHRFDDDWVYGLPEHFRDLVRHAKRIANPGCYATAIQLAIRPVLDLLDGVPVIFGVSGYSGAGTVSSDRNDPEKLRDNLMPYSLTGHVHEREAAHHLGRAVRFHPHVAPFFRGITLTVSMPLRKRTPHATIDLRYVGAYLGEPLVKYISDVPYVRDIASKPMCVLGGLTLSEDDHHAVIVATIDNLLKGAATQAVQNINLACGFDEFTALL